MGDVGETISTRTGGSSTLTAGTGVDERLGNPFLELVQPVRRYRGRPMARLDCDVVEGQWRYSWAVPTDEALDAIARLSPVVEVGAGTGYWARLLRDRGVDVVAYDVAPPGGPGHNRWHCEVPVRTWTEVLRGDSWRAGSHPDRTLFLCWPPLGTPMARDALRAYRGENVVYVGEGPWTSDGPWATANLAFGELLTASYRRVGEPILLPSFSDVTSLTVWRAASASSAERRPSISQPVDQEAFRMLHGSSSQPAIS